MSAKLSMPKATAQMLASNPDNISEVITCVIQEQEEDPPELAIAMMLIKLSEDSRSSLLHNHITRLYHNIHSNSTHKHEIASDMDESQQAGVGGGGEESSARYSMPCGKHHI